MCGTFELNLLLSGDCGSSDFFACDMSFRDDVLAVVVVELFVELEV